MEDKFINDELKAENEKLKLEVEYYKKKFENETQVSQKLNAYSKLSPVALIDWDLELKAEYWNKSAESIFKYTEEEAIGQYAWNFVIPSQKEIIRKHLQRILTNKASDHFITTILSSAGEEIICDWHIASIIFNGELVGITTVVFDLTKQKKIERELFESNERFKTLSNVSFEAIFLSDKGYGVDVNAVGIEMFGYSLEEIKTMFATALFTEESKEIVKNNILSGYLEPYEVMAVKKDGTVFPVEVQGKNYMYNNRNIRVTAIRDITERKKAKLELKKQELKFKTIFENTGYGIAVGNMDKIVVDVNASFCKMTGYQKDEIVGGRIEFLFDKQSLDKKPLRYDLLDQSKSVVHERIIIRKDGKKVPIEMTSNKVDDNFYISFYNDLSERLKTEKALEKFNQKLKKAKEKAEESNNLKTAFLQNMSHEIRTPMNGIIGFSEMLNHPDVSEERRIFYTNIIIKSSQHLLDIVNNILDISKVETGLAEVAPNETNINKLMLDLFSFYQPQAWEKNVNMHINLPLEEDESTIMVDDIKLRQVLSNLLSNALKFTHDGYIKMGYVKKRKKLEFYVEDTGIGIEGALHDKIFERFRQAELSTTRKYGGTGLGLSISQAYVRLLKGELWLISKKDEGSTFYFNIPIVKPSKRSLKIINNSINDLIDNNNAPKGQILIAEDEEFNFLYLTELLRGLGLDILHANTGMEAIEMVKANPNISLVLMDLKMPGLNGLEATKKIKKIRPELSIIAQTAYAMVEDREKAINAGCDNYISKPINRADFLNMIRKYI